MTKHLRILGIAGSLRQASYNKALLKSAIELAPDSVDIRVFDLAGIPLFNQDIEDQGDPERVKALKQAIAEADALLICTPEYNYSIPGVLKNALDWASRPSETSVLDGKPVAVMGASTGRFGTARCQMALHNVFSTCNMHPLNFPQVLVPDVTKKCDDVGRLTDERTRRLIRDMLEALAEWTILVHGGKKAGDNC